MRRHGDDQRIAAALAVLGLGMAAGGARFATAIDRVRPGQYLLKEIGAGASRSVCLDRPGKILQIAHGTSPCTHRLLESEGDRMVVRYSCAGRGHGQSMFTYSTPTSFRLQTQGMVGGAPFDLDYDARRTGDCGAPIPAR